MPALLCPPGPEMVAPNELSFVPELSELQEPAAASKIIRARQSVSLRGIATAGVIGESRSHTEAKRFAVAQCNSMMEKRLDADKEKGA